MNILLCPHNYFGNNTAGGEHYLHRLAKGLQSLGHSVKAIVICKKAYVYDGIECYPQGGMERIFMDNNDLVKWADVIFSQLLGSSYAYNKSHQHNKPLVFFAHNTSKHYFIHPSNKVVYNSYHLQSLKLFPNESTVLQPLVEKAELVFKGTKIALINCCEMKGGKHFTELAKMMPKEQFLGIKGGYGIQYVTKLPNLEYRENSESIDWSDIKLLLVLSEIESWSQVATEAIMRGIPVISVDLPGVRENLSYAGIYIERNDIYSYVEAIENMDYEKQRAICLQRAKELDPEPRLKVFNEWLINNKWTL